MAKKPDKNYNKGVKDALRILYTHINTMDHAAGFENSRLAQEYSVILKDLYNTVGTLIK